MKPIISSLILLCSYLACNGMVDVFHQDQQLFFHCLPRDLTKELGLFMVNESAAVLTHLIEEQKTLNSGKIPHQMLDKRLSDGHLVFRTSPDNQDTFLLESIFNSCTYEWKKEGLRWQKTHLANASNSLIAAIHPNITALINAELLSAGIASWDITSATHKQSFLGGNRIALSIAYSPDGKLMTTASAHGMQLWNAQTGELVYNKPHTHVRDACFIDNTTVAFASGANIFVCSIDGRVEKEPLVNTANIGQIAYNASSKLLAAGSYNGTVRIWDITKGQCIQEFSHPYKSYVCLALSHDGSLVASVDLYNNFYLWEARTGRIVHTFSPPMGYGGIGSREFGNIGSMAFSADSSLLAVAYSYVTVLYQLFESGADKVLMKNMDIANTYTMIKSMETLPRIPLPQPISRLSRIVSTEIPQHVLGTLTTTAVAYGVYRWFKK